LSDDDKIKECFVAMPITTSEFYVSRCGDADHFQHVLDHLFTPALESAGYVAIPPASSGSELIHAEIIRHLEQADLVLCDLSGLNPNVFFELGIRTALDRPLAIVKDNLTPQLPFDLSAVNTLTYDCTLNPWTLTSEIPQMAEHIVRSTRASANGNVMWRYFGLTKRASPAEVSSNPLEAKVDFIISEITSGRLWQRVEGKQRLVAIADATSDAPMPDHLIRAAQQIQEIAQSENVSMSVSYDAESGSILLQSETALPPKMRERIALTTGIADIRTRIVERENER
jgi:hypothetical protein